jgi:hypothetical protein
MARTTLTYPFTVPFFPFSISLFVMLRSIILCPLGGDSGIKRQRYTAREKIAIVGKICHVKRKTNVSCRQAAASVGVSHRLVIRWHALRERYNNIDIKKLPQYSAYHGP